MLQWQMQVTDVFGGTYGLEYSTSKYICPIQYLPLWVATNCGSLSAYDFTNGLENHNVWRYRFDLNEVYLSAPRLLGVYSRNRHKVHLLETEKYRVEAARVEERHIAGPVTGLNANQVYS